jgi:hypothetical protein
MKQEINVTARAVLVKENTTIWGSEGHTCVDWDINPNTGRREPSGYWESDDNLEELFRCQQRSPAEIIELCERLCRQLVKEGRNFQHYEVLPGKERVVDLRDLAMDCAGWEETLDVREIYNEQDTKNIIEFL